VLHIFLAVNIVAFSLGIVVLILGTLSFQRSGRAPFRIFTLLFSGAIIYLLQEIIRLYSRATLAVFGDALPQVSMVLSGIANGLVAYAIPVLALQLVNRRMSRAGMIVHGVVIALLLAVGILDDLFPATLLPAANLVALTCLQLYGMAVVAFGFKRIQDPTVRSLACTSIVIALIMVVLISAEHWVGSLPGSPPLLREYGFAELGYYLAAAILLLVYALRYLFKWESPAVPAALPDQFIVKYGISPREREIISMMLQGYGNRKISETLFISALTVKNHIYHIYQKTGVANKVQLINIINSPK
jgi:DNA-binding CsgD family transcriptional regulator